MGDAGLGQSQPTTAAGGAEPLGASSLSLEEFTRLGFGFDSWLLLVSWHVATQAARRADGIENVLRGEIRARGH